MDTHTRSICVLTAPCVAGAAGRQPDSGPPPVRLSVAPGGVECTLDRDRFKFPGWDSIHSSTGPTVLGGGVLDSRRVTANMVGAMRGWDPYPFILLNLAVSFQAAYAAPVIMMSQNRQQDIDRKAAENDYRINEGGA